MNIGSLSKRITLQYPTKTPDSMGGFVTVWNDACTIFASLWPVSASEQVQNMGVTMTITHRIRIRYRANIRSSWRIHYGDKLYNIVSIINPNMAYKILDIMAKEATN